MDEIVLTRKSYLTRHWWAPAGRGGFAIAAGVTMLGVGLRLRASLK